jgi:hypothetical protein
VTTDRFRTKPEDFTAIAGSFTGPQMASEIVRAGVRRMHQAELEQALVSIVARPSVSKDPRMFVSAMVPPGFPGKGNLFVTDDQGKRWRIRQDPDSLAFRTQEQQPRRTG